MPINHRKVMLSLNEETKTKLDLIVKELKANSRSEVIRWLINQEADKIKKP